MSAEPLPFTAFHTGLVEPEDSFEAWRQIMAPMFDMAPVRGEAAFLGAVQAWHLGHLVVGGHQSLDVRFSRDSRSLANGIDHYLIQLYLDGGFTCEAGEDVVSVGRGDISLLDLGRPLDGIAMASNAVSVVIPREALEGRLASPGDLHGLVLRGDSAMGGLLAEYLKSLSTRLGRLSQEEAPLVAGATLDIAAACFQPTADAVARARPALAVAALERIKRHIEANLRSPTLSPESICAAFRMSRTHLYRLFAPVGSVSRYIQARRLRKAHDALADPRQRGKKVSQIAFEWGFASEAHFSRAFRAAFGMSPRECRARQHEDPSAATIQVAQDLALTEWVGRLGR